MTLAARFWAKVDKRGPNECWPWLGSTRRGYGRIWDNGQARPAHQVAWELWREGEPFPNGMDACHHCDNPSCVNPAHIFPGTASDNAIDARDKGRLEANAPRWQEAKTHCSRGGHEFTPENIGYTPKGWRYCLTCRALRNRARTDPEAMREWEAMVR